MSQPKKDMPGYYDGVKLLPTPQVGDRVIWYDRADKTQSPVCADVITVEAPGRVAVQLHTRYKSPKTRGNDCIDGVKHVSHEDHKDTPANTRDCGGWDWHRGIVPADAYDFHRKELERKELARMIEQEANEKRLALRKELATA